MLGIYFTKYEQLIGGGEVCLIKRHRTQLCHISQLHTSRLHSNYTGDNVVKYALFKGLQTIWGCTSASCPEGVIYTISFQVSLSVFSSSLVECCCLIRRVLQMFFSLERNAKAYQDLRLQLDYLVWMQCQIKMTSLEFGSISLKRHVKVTKKHS